MNTIEEFDNFILKFKNLWKSGYDAHLEVDTHAGQAWVGLCLCLGDAPDPFKYKRVSPSRHRRRERRAEARQTVAKTSERTLIRNNENADVKKEAEEAENVCADVVKLKNCFDNKNY